MSDIDELKASEIYSKGELYRMAKVSLKDARFFRTAARMFAVLWVLTIIIALCIFNWPY